MFGFGGKRKKMVKQFHTMISSVMGTYILMRSIGSFKFDETKLEPMAIQILEACYILGVIDCLAHSLDPDEEIIGQDLIINTCEDCTIGMGIFDESDAAGIFQGALLFVEEGNAAHELMYKGAKSAEACTKAMFDGEDSSKAVKAMNLDYLNDADLVDNFRELFDIKIKGKKS